MAKIGIDLGTTNSLAAVWTERGVECIPNAFGEYLTPSIVSFDKEETVYVGKIAKERLITHPQDTFREFKRTMGSNKKYKIGLYANKKIEYSSEELSAFVLRQLKEDAENFLGEKVDEAVISVPAYFDDKQRAATRAAGLLAGLKVERLINEPSAAALANSIQSDDEHQIYVVFDFGGGTLDVSIVDAFDNIVEIQAVSGDNSLGGKDFNNVIADYFYLYNGIMKTALTESDKEIVYKEAELLKQELSLKNEAMRKIRIGEKVYDMHLTNQKLIDLSTALFKRMMAPLQNVINDSGLEIEDIDKIILVGGSSKMPVVRQYIGKLFENEVICDIDPDKIVAMGTGVVSGIKERRQEIKDVILSDICPFTLGVALYNGKMSPIINRNAILPCSRVESYTTVEPFQKKIDIQIYQGEDLYVKNNTLLSAIEVEVPELPASEAFVNVRFSYDINGIFDVDILCLNNRELTSKSFVNSNTGLSDKEIEKRRQELEKLKIPPRENNENKLLLETAERLYRESNQEKRLKITQYLEMFEAALATQNEKTMKDAYIKLSMFLAAIEREQFHFIGSESDTEDDKI